MNTLGSNPHSGSTALKARGGPVTSTDAYKTAMNKFGLELEQAFWPALETSYSTGIYENIPDYQNVAEDWRRWPREPPLALYFHAAQLPHHHHSRQRNQAGKSWLQTAKKPGPWHRPQPHPPDPGKSCNPGSFSSPVTDGNSSWVVSHQPLLWGLLLTQLWSALENSRLLAGFPRGRFELRTCGTIFTAEEIFWCSYRSWPVLTQRDALTDIGTQGRSLRSRQTHP